MSELSRKAMEAAKRAAKKKARAAQRRTRREFGKTPVGQLARSLYSLAHGGTGKQRQINDIVDELLDPSQANEVQRAGGLEKYALE